MDDLGYVDVVVGPRVAVDLEDMVGATYLVAQDPRIEQIRTALGASVTGVAGPDRVTSRTPAHRRSFRPWVVPMGQAWPGVPRPAMSVRTPERWPEAGKFTGFFDSGGMTG